MRCAQAAAELRAVAVGQPHVHDDDVGTDGRHAGQRLGDRARLAGDRDARDRPRAPRPRRGGPPRGRRPGRPGRSGAASISTRPLPVRRTGAPEPRACAGPRDSESGRQQQRRVEGQARARRPWPRPGRRRRPSSSSTSSTVADEQLPCSASTRREAPICSSVSPSSSRTTSRMRGPPGCTAQPATSSIRSPAVGEQLVDDVAHVPGQHVGHPRGQPHPEAEVGDVPGHVVGGGGVGARDDPGHPAAAGRARLDDDGRRGVGEQRVRDDLLEVAPGPAARAGWSARSRAAPPGGTRAATKSLTAARPGIAA